MPEIAECRLESAHINSRFNRIPVSISKCSDSKRSFTLPQTYQNRIENGCWLRSDSRGKQIRILLCFDDVRLPITFNLGMSGSFRWSIDKPKHAHICFSFGENTESLWYVDPRRFGTWRFSDYDEKRGPDLIDEYEAFCENVYRHCMFANRPIAEVLMDQRYFNGIGNYLRAESLYRTDTNPFMRTGDLFSRDDSWIFLATIKQICLEAYELGGGQLKTYVSHTDTPKQSFTDWLQCYGKKNMATMYDATGRKLYYHPKYSKAIQS